MITGFSLVGFIPSGKFTTRLLLSPIYTSQSGMIALVLSVTLTTKVSFLSLSSLPTVPLSSPVDDWLLGTFNIPLESVLPVALLLFLSTTKIAISGAASPFSVLVTSIDVWSAKSRSLPSGSLIDTLSFTSMVTSALNTGILFISYSLME